MSMRWAMLIILAGPLVAWCEDTRVGEPVVTITGHYRCNDGRVRDHAFPVVIRLQTNGTFSGTSESWIEDRLSSGGSRLGFFTNRFSGKWTVENHTVRMAVQEGPVLPQLTFGDLNGLNIVMEKRAIDPTAEEMANERTLPDAFDCLAVAAQVITANNWSKSDPAAGKILNETDAHWDVTFPIPDATQGGEKPDHRIIRIFKTTHKAQELGMD